MSAKRTELLKQFPPEFKDLWFIHHMTGTELCHLLVAIHDYGDRRQLEERDASRQESEQRLRKPLSL